MDVQDEVNKRAWGATGELKEMPIKGCDQHEMITIYILVSNEDFNCKETS